MQLITAGCEIGLYFIEAIKTITALWNCTKFADDNANVGFSFVSHFTYNIDNFNQFIKSYVRYQNYNIALVRTDIHEFATFSHRN